MFHPKLIIIVIILIFQNVQSDCIDSWFADAKFELLSVNRTDFKKYLTIKIGDVGANLTVSCLTGGIDPPVDHLDLKDYFKWIYQPYNVTAVNNDLWYDVVSWSWVTNYTFGECHEINFMFISETGDIGGRYKCVPKGNQNVVHSRSEVEIVVDVDTAHYLNNSTLDLVIESPNVDICSEENRKLLEKDNVANFFRRLFEHDIFVFEELEKMHKVFNLLGYGPRNMTYNTATIAAYQTYWGPCQPCDAQKGTRKSLLRWFLIFRRGNKNPDKEGYNHVVTNVLSLQALNNTIGTYLALKKIKVTKLKNHVAYWLSVHTSRIRACVAFTECQPLGCPVKIKPVDIDVKVNPNQIIDEIRKRKKRPKLELDVRQFKNFEILSKYETFDTELDCKPSSSSLEEESALEDNSFYWYKCVDSCVKIKGFFFLRFSVDRSEGSLKIQKLALRDSAFYVCTQRQTVLKIIYIKVFSSNKLWDIRTPVGAMFFATIIIFSIYLLFFLARVGLFSCLIRLFRKKRVKNHEYQQIKVSKRKKKDAKKETRIGVQLDSN